MVTLSETAAGKIKEILAQEGKTGWALKLGVQGGGCSGMEYVMDFAQTPSAEEKVFEDKGVKLFVNAQSEGVLKGVVIDYEEGLTGAGFKIQNPNSKGSCGCGHSFEA